MKKLEDIKILTEAERITVEVYSLLKKLPSFEKFALSSQISRATVSVCANIAEGFYRATHKDFSHFLSMSRGSAGETIVLLQICSKLKYIKEDEFDSIKNDYEKLIISINSLIKYLNKK